ncbi:hypothetical protein [Elongatibacter sediminis]|uniref:Uncharacterized protein n=1 Tax=Elongatibacter sediminis TaxID=3119006 RepID=A0AAW9RBR9_9GAMM
MKLLLLVLLLGCWVAAYFWLPHRTSLEGPFEAEPFGFDPIGLPVMSQTDLKILGVTFFVLEARQNLGPAPGTVFVLRGRDGKVRWSRLGAPELGRIELERRSARWFAPGGWVIDMKPEYTGQGEIYVSPLGNFRFFFHRW